MKSTRSIITSSIIITVFSFLPLTDLLAQETEQLIILSSKVGELIDSTERSYYHLFPLDKNFVRAKFYLNPDSTYFARVESIGLDGTPEFTKRDFSKAMIFQVAEKINHYEELVANEYTMGKDPPAIHVVNGASIFWSETHHKARENFGPSSATVPTVPDSLESPTNFEMRFSAGYGFPKGGYPGRSYDRISTPLSNSSIDEMRNVNDKYYSASEGIRYECGIIAYVSKHIGLFVEGGYSSATENTKSSRTYNYIFQSPPYISTIDQTLEFSSLSILAGLHFRVREKTVEPYGGVGAGIFSLKFTAAATLTSGGSHSEQEMTFTTNTPVGYTGYLGVNVNLHPQISLFAEAKATVVSFYVTREELTKYFVDGKDQLAGLKVKDKVTVYEENKNYSRVTPGDEGEPLNGGPPVPFPGDIVAITVGISFHF